MTQADLRCTRREVMQAAVAAGIGAALPSSLVAAAASTLPITKAIPATGEMMPIVGVGTNRFGDIEAPVVRDILKRMSELGGTIIDTAGRYTGSEERIGPAMAEMKPRSKFFLSTKFNAAGINSDPPRLMEGAGRLPSDPIGGLASFERSLKRLQTDQIDLLMVHWLSSVETLMPVLIDLKRAGRVRYIGIGTVTAPMHPRLASFMRKYPLDFIQVDYSLGNRSAEQELFPLAMERKIAVMVAQPFGGAGSLLFNKVNGQVLPPWAAEQGIASWGQFFLKYVVSHPAVTCAVPGSTKVTHVDDNQAAARGSLPSAARRKQMEAFWDGSA